MRAGVRGATSASPLGVYAVRFRRGIAFIQVGEGSHGAVTLEVCLAERVGFEPYHLLESVTYRNHVAVIAMNAILAVAPCT